jgi:hypothetical protein
LIWSYFSKCNIGILIPSPNFLQLGKTLGYFCLCNIHKCIYIRNIFSFVVNFYFKVGEFRKVKCREFKSLYFLSFFLFFLPSVFGSGVTSDIKWFQRPLPIAVAGIKLWSSLSNPASTNDQQSNPHLDFKYLSYQIKLFYI